MFAYFDLIMQDYLEIDDSTAVYLVEVSKNEEDPLLNTYAIKALSSNLEKLSKDPHTGSTRYWPIPTELLLANANDEDKKAAIFPESENELLSQALPLAEGELTSRALSLPDLENYLKFNPNNTTPAIFSTEAARAIYSYVADNSFNELGIFEEDSDENIFHEQMRIRESDINYEDYLRYVQRVISEPMDTSGIGSSFDARVEILKRRLGDLAQSIEGVHSEPGPLRERLFDVIDLQDELDNISVSWLALYKLDNKIVSIEAQIEELRIMKDILTDQLGLLKTTIEQAEILKNDSAEADDASKASDVSGDHAPIYQPQLTKALQEAEDSFRALQSDVEAFGGERDEYDDTLRKIEVISSSLSEHVRSATQNIQFSKREARSRSEEVRLVRNMMESISNEKARLIAVKRSGDPRIGILDAMYTELKSHHENFIHLEKELGSQIRAKEKLIVNTLKTIDAYVGSKRLHDLSVGNSWVNFVRRTLLQPIHSLIKKWKEHPYQPQTFAGRTEKTIAQLANEVTLRFEKIAEEAGFVVKKPPARGLYGVLPKIVSSTTQTLPEQFQSANDKGAFILENCLDENFYSNISSARFKEARKEACQRLVTDRKHYNFDALIIKLSDLCFSLKGPEFIRKGAGDFLGELLLELAKQTETEQNNFVTQYKGSAAGYPANYQFSQDIAHAFSLIKQVAQAYDEREEEQNNKQYVARLPGNLVNKIFNNLVMASVTQQELSSVAAKLRTDNNNNEERDKYFAERMAARQSVNPTIVQEYLDSNARHKHAAYHHAIKTIGDIIETRGWGNGKSGHFFKGSEATASIAQLIRQYTDKGESTEDSLDKLYNAVCMKAKEVLDTSKGQKHAFYLNIVNDWYLTEAYKSSAHVDENNNEDRAARYHSFN